LNDDRRRMKEHPSAPQIIVAASGKCNDFCQIPRILCLTGRGPPPAFEHALAASGPCARSLLQMSGGVLLCLSVQFAGIASVDFADARCQWIKYLGHGFSRQRRRNARVSYPGRTVLAYELNPQRRAAFYWHRDLGRWKGRPVSCRSGIDSCGKGSLLPNRVGAPQAASDTNASRRATSC